MEFKRFGKSFQMKLEDGNDLKEALTLDESLWVALSAPNEVFRCDPKLLEFLDVDNDKRITTKDVRRGIKWLLDQIPNHDEIKPDFDGNLKISSINNNTDEGKALIDSAKWITQELAPADKSIITLGQVRSFLDTVQKRDLNGDGVLTLLAAQRASTDAYKEEVTELVKNVVATTGGTTDLDGSQGLDEKTMTAFLAAIPPYLEWQAKGQIPEGEKTTVIMTMGADTPALDALLNANAAKIDQFFKISNLLDFDGRIEPKALSPESKVATFDPALQAEVDEYQNSLPIATPNADRMLPLDPEKINPAFRAWYSDLVSKIIKPILGAQNEGLTQDDWNKVKGTFAAYESYIASKQGGIVESIPVDVLKKYVSCDALQEEVRALMAIDKDVSNKVAAAHQMEKLLLYRTEMLRLTNNFISFTDLYSPDTHAMFESGKLVIDGRWFAVAFKITSVAAHQALAKNSQMFLMYVDVQPKVGAKYSVVVPVTSGTKGNLMVGKRGIFYDNDGNDCDATVVNIVENPVCIKEALLAPLSRLWGIVEGKITEWSGSAEKNLQSNFTKAITPDAAAAAAAPAPAPAAKDAAGGNKANAFMGIGIAAAAIGSAFTFLMKTLTSMSGTAIWITVLVAILALMLPITIIAIIKLNRQDLSSILEGCGWGINMKVRLDSKLRNQFTYFGKYPKGAKGTPKAYALKMTIIIVLIAACAFGGYKYYKYRKLEAARIEAEKIEQQKREEAEKKAQELQKAKEAEAAAQTKAEKAEAKEDVKQAKEELKQAAAEVKEAKDKVAEEKAKVEEKKEEEKAEAAAKVEQVKQELKDAVKQAAENAAK